MVRRHLLAQIEFIGRERAAVQRFRPHLVWYSRGLCGAAEFRREVMRIESLRDLLSRCERFFLTADRLAVDEPLLVDAEAEACSLG